MGKYTLLGKDMKRIDTAAKATGEAIFSADLSLPRMLVGKVLRSPYPHARIVSIETSKAEALPGVRAVITGHDSSGEKWGVFRYTQDQAFQGRAVRTRDFKYISFSHGSRRELLFDLRNKAVRGKPEKTHEMRQARRELAQVMTIINERRKGAAVAAPAA